MAEDKDDNTDDNGGEQEVTLESKIDLIASQSFRQMVLASLCLVLMPVLFVVCVVSLATAVKTSDRLFAIEPNNRAEIFGKKIKKVQADVEAQYGEYHAKMEDQSIFNVNEKFEILYELSRESEADYGKMLIVHQKSVYQIASKVRGSGEWYHYHDRKLARLVATGSRRQAQMDRYFQRD